MRTGEVAVLGCGLCTPPAASAAEALGALRAGAAGSEAGPPSPPPIFSAAELAAASGLARREVRKLDRFALLAVAAARRALAAAGLEPETWRPCGVVTGNMLAGWTFTEPELRALHGGGAPAVSPYLATAWFPAAPQGQITIQLGLTGFAKTLTTDRCAGAQALGLAYERVLQGRDRLLLAGGVEAPRTPLVETARALAGEGGVPLGEGAAFAVLAPWEGRGTAVAAYACLAGQPAAGLDGQLDRRLDEVLAPLLDEVAPRLGETAQTAPVSAVWVDVEPAGGAEEVWRRALAASRLLAGVPVWFPGRLFGETLAAGAALSLVLATEALREAAGPGSAVVISAGASILELLWLTRTERVDETARKTA